MTDKVNKPFGLLFEQEAIEGIEIPTPVYDSDSSLSFTKDDKGKLIPFIEMRPSYSTETLTEAEGEKTNADDRTPGIFLGTETMTAVKAEGTDDDKKAHYENPIGNIVLSTETLTKADGEKVDDD